MKIERRNIDINSLFTKRFRTVHHQNKNKRKKDSLLYTGP